MKAKRNTAATRHTDSLTYSTFRTRPHDTHTHKPKRKEIKKRELPWVPLAPLGPFGTCLLGSHGLARGTPSTPLSRLPSFGRLSLNDGDGLLVDSTHTPSLLRKKLEPRTARTSTNYTNMHHAKPMEETQQRTATFNKWVYLYGGKGGARKKQSYPTIEMQV